MRSVTRVNKAWIEWGEGDEAWQMPRLTLEVDALPDRHQMRFCEKTVGSVAYWYGVDPDGFVEAFGQDTAVKGGNEEYVTLLMGNVPYPINTDSIRPINVVLVTREFQPTVQVHYLAPMTGAKTLGFLTLRCAVRLVEWCEGVVLRPVKAGPAGVLYVPSLRIPPHEGACAPGNNGRCDRCGQRVFEEARTRFTAEELFECMFKHL